MQKRGSRLEDLRAYLVASTPFFYFVDLILPSSEPDSKTAVDVCLFIIVVRNLWASVLVHPPPPPPFSFLQSPPPLSHKSHLGVATTPRRLTAVQVISAQTRHNWWYALVSSAAHLGIIASLIGPMVLATFFWYTASIQIGTWSPARQSIAVFVAVWVMIYSMASFFHLLSYYYRSRSRVIERVPSSKTARKDGAAGACSSCLTFIGCGTAVTDVRRRTRRARHQLDLDERAIEQAGDHDTCSTASCRLCGIRARKVCLPCGVRLSFGFWWLWNIIYNTLFIVTAMASTYYLATLLFWTLLGIFVNPTAAVPLAVAITGLWLHVTTLRRSMESKVGWFFFFFVRFIFVFDPHLPFSSCGFVLPFHSRSNNRCDDLRCCAWQIMAVEAMLLEHVNRLLNKIPGFGKVTITSPLETLRSGGKVKVRFARGTS